MLGPGSEVLAQRRTVEVVGCHLDVLGMSGLG